MEDYTYHLHPSGGKVLGAHMLELCPSLAARTPCCEIHPLGIGGKSDPVRLVFTAPAGPAVNAALLDMGDRFRLLLNEVDAVEPEADLPRLPVARALVAPAQSKDGGGGLDLRRRAAPYRLQSGPHQRARRRPGRNDRHRMSANRFRHAAGRLQESVALEPGVFQPRQFLTI